MMGKHMNPACLRIVVADDEPDMREYFERILPRMGHEVVAAASNGRELLELSEPKCPRLTKSRSCWN